MQPAEPIIETINNSLYVVGSVRDEIALVRKAAEKFIALPEGHETLQEIVRAHKKPVVISVSSDPDEDPNEVGLYIKPQFVALHVNLDALKRVHFTTTERKKEYFSIERFIAHEMKHGTQINSVALMNKFAVKRNAYLHDNVMPDDVDISTFSNQLMSAGTNPERIKAVFTVLYDNLLKTEIENKLRQRLKSFAHDPIVQQYIKECEAPAIAFENQIAKQFGQPERLNDYLGSTDIEQTFESVRNNTITSLVYSQLKSLGIPYRSSGYSGFQDL